MIINWISYPIDLVKNSLMALFLSHVFQIYQQIIPALSLNYIQSLTTSHPLNYDNLDPTSILDNY